VECLSAREIQCEGRAEQAETSEAQRGFYVLDFTKETKSEETVVTTKDYLYKYIRTSHTTLRRRVMICRMHHKVRSKVTRRLQQR